MARSPTLAETSPSWRTLSDEALLEATFDIFDPEKLPGVVSDLPVDYMESVLEASYNTKFTTGEFVRCIHCSKNNHYLGFVFRTQRGDRILVGIDCGEKIYGVQFNLQQNDFNAAKARRNALLARRYIADHANELLSFLHNLQSHPSITQFRGTRSAFMRAMPALARDVLNACVRGGGSLSIDVQSRNIQAEIARDERLDSFEDQLAAETITRTERKRRRRDYAEQRRRHIYQYTPSFIGTLVGQPFFLTATHTPHIQIPQLVEAIEHALLDLSGEAPRDRNKLRSPLRALSDSLGEIITQMETLRALQDAFSNSNLELLARWGNARDSVGDSYESHSFMLARRPGAAGDDRGHTAQSVGYPQDYAPPNAQAFVVYKKAVDEGL